MEIPGEQAKTKVYNIMKDKWAPEHVLCMGTQWKDAMKQERRVLGAATKDKTNISAPVPKSGAATAEQTTKHSQRTAHYSKEKRKSSRSKQKNAYPDYIRYENFSD